MSRRLTIVQTPVAELRQRRVSTEVLTTPASLDAIERSARAVGHMVDRNGSTMVVTSARTGTATRYEGSERA